MTLYRLILTISAALALAQASWAIIFVDSRATTGTQDGSSWQNAFTSITAALSSLESGGTLWVREGVYRERIALKTYQNIYGGFLGFETSADQRIAGAFPTIIDAESKGRAVDIKTGAWVTIDGLTIRNGLADYGGGIRCNINANVKIRNCHIEDCSATALGGGVYHDKYSYGEMTDCIVTRCNASSGGGLVVEYHSYPVHKRCVITRNSAVISGGGLYCPFHSEARMENCTFAFNNAGMNGGAAYTYRGGPVAFDHDIIAFNSASDTGGVYGDGGSSTTTFTCCDFYANDNGDCGGAIGSISTYSGNMFVDPLLLMPEHDECCLSLGSPCDGIGAYPIETAYPISKIGHVKILPTGTAVKLSGKVISCTNGTNIWIEEIDRSATIGVQGVSDCSPGDVISSLIGTISVDDNEKRYISVSSWEKLEGAGYDLVPYGTRISWLDSAVGTYMKTWGRMIKTDNDGFQLSDGENSIDVLWSGMEIRPHSYVVVTGGYIGYGQFQAYNVQIVR
ncbi:right-handed parallel beta-helix repeat-containing protein [bacterium]|nr:right-handed parallel beta-helix repeat-containing protein [bacterium]